MGLNDVCLTSLMYAWPWKQLLLCDCLIHVSPRQGLAFYFHVISEIRCNHLWWYLVSKTMAWTHWNHLNMDFYFLCVWFLINGNRIFILSLEFKFQSIAFPIPNLPFFLFIFPKRKPAAAGPGSWLSARTQQASDMDVFSCYITLSPFPSPSAFTVWSRWESPRGAKPRKGAAPREGCVFQKLLYVLPWMRELPCAY